MQRKATARLAGHVNECVYIDAELDVDLVQIGDLCRVGMAEQDRHHNDKVFVKAVRWGNIHTSQTS